MGATNELYGGSIADFEDSMAQEIEKAYDDVLRENSKQPLSSANAEDRRMLFVAIARGVINHLMNKHQALSVVLPPLPVNQAVFVDIAKR